MKEFYGSASFTGRVKFVVQATCEEEAKDYVFEDLEGMNIVIKDGSTVGIDEVEWELIDEISRGNMSESFISDFDIQEEE